MNRLGKASIAIEYLNNHCSQRTVREVLRKNGVSENNIKLIDWNKSNFPGLLFTAVYGKPLSQWPSAKGNTK